MTNLSLLTFSLILSAVAQTSTKQDEDAIRQCATKYADAFNKGDLDTLVSMYTKDAIYDDGDGVVITGREEIRKKLKENFDESPGAKMTLDIKAIRFARGRGIETGMATITPTKGDPETVPYRATHQKQPDGKWLMSSVGPDAPGDDAAGAGPLADLTWMLGSWKDAEADLDITCDCSWTANHHFLLRSFVMHDKDAPEMKITEVIGWDPVNRTVRSWVFDTDGGFAQNTWSHRGDDWIMSAKGTLADGGIASAVNIIHQVDANTYTWSSTNRDVDGAMLPDVKDVKMVRSSDSTAPAEGGKP
jgi:uncharacterized protein (TIGR02246 family)